MRSPRGLGEGVGGEQIAVLSIDDIEEPVLRRVHQGLDVAAFNLEIGKDDVHRRRVVPGIARNCLVVPQVLAGIGIECDDRAQE